ncbi:hypothetical protein GCM10020367_45390 [Streptomyces sannanensis]|uniref:Uncharacterized protein n=1 Tax=Streptomyces sannanensis TaxID=285536 RepID=A0ABP6SFV9_9ACTN
MYGPDGRIPALPADFTPLAIRAVDRILAPASELCDLWGETSDAEEWTRTVTTLRGVLTRAAG